MKNQLFTILLVSLASSRAKDEDLPLCPIHFQYFPQKLPMHCRMPTRADFPTYPGMEGLPTMAPSEIKPPGMPMPAPLPPGMPMPGPLPPGMPVLMPPGIQGPAPMTMPGAMPMMPMPGPMMPMPGQPGQKVPVIVMPFYSPDKSYRKPKPHKKPKKPVSPRESTDSSSETDTDADTDTDISSDISDGDTSSDKGWWKGKRYGWRRNGRRSSKRRHSHRSKRRHNKNKKNLLTPVLQYVTNDGYVIYEKKISKGEAKDWLRVNKEEQNPVEHEGRKLNEEGKNDEGNASVHEKRNNIEVKIDKSNEDDREKDEGDKEDERDKEEVTTVVAHVRRHHRKAGNKLSDAADGRG